MNKILFALIGFVFLSACTKKQGLPVVKDLNTTGIKSVGPYLTKDNKGNAVLCWTEQDRNDSLYRLKYAVYDQQTDKFNPAVTIPVSAGCSTTAESMAKIAFKSDGTIVAVFGKSFPKEKNPYAGAIYYSLSADEGKSWSDARFLHSDTAHTYGRSFFDVATLKNGELAAIWLDGRFGKAIKGSALFFSHTEKGKGFVQDTCLDKGTCECCRTDILKDDAGNIHLAYRSIMFPSELSGKQVRDMVYKSSTDNGKTFSPAKTISKDNWEIEGCPHSGPSLAIVKNTVNVVWFTAGGSPGLYSASAPAPGTDFHDRNLITATGRHPQMAALSDGKVVMAYEEPQEAESEKPMEMNHSHRGMMMTHAPAGAAKIVLQMLTNGNPGKSITITGGEQSDNHAVLIPVDQGLLVAWIREGKTGSGICYSRLNTIE